MRLSGLHSKPMQLTVLPFLSRWQHCYIDSFQQIKEEGPEPLPSTSSGRPLGWYARKSCEQHQAVRRRRCFHTYCPPPYPYWEVSLVIQSSARYKRYLKYIIFLLKAVNPTALGSCNGYLGQQVLPIPRIITPHISSPSQSSSRAQSLPQVVVLPRPSTA